MALVSTVINQVVLLPVPPDPAQLGLVVIGSSTITTAALEAKALLDP
jgi:hypothetical protein